MTHECATPACTNTGQHGRLRIWCRACSTRLARIRTEFEAEEPTSRSNLGRTLAPRAA